MKGSRRKGARDPEPGEDSRGTTAAGVWEQVSTLVVAILIALAIRAFVVEPYRIPSGSMFPTLLIGDHLFVNKFIYGIKIPFTDLRLPAIREPERGDVVVFTVAKRGTQTYPADRRSDLPREEFVKRVIGLPGDRIDMRDGVVYLNGEPVEAQRLAETFVDEAGRDLLVEQVSLGDRSFRILDDPNLALSSTRPISVTVEPGRYFVLGDNRDHSKDSRFWGTVRLAEIKGPAFVLYWSWDFNGSWGELLNPGTWWRLLTERMRWGRIGRAVE
jgi:signal peptidase I